MVCNSSIIIQGITMSGDSFRCLKTVFGFHRKRMNLVFLTYFFTMIFTSLWFHSNTWKYIISSSTGAT